MHHVKNHKNEDNTMKEKENKNDESFHSRHSGGIRRSEIADSKVKKKNLKFTQTLSEIRSYIQTISAKR